MRTFPLLVLVPLILCAHFAAAAKIEDDEVVTFPVWPDRDTVPAIKPDWCEKYVAGNGMGNTLYNTQRALNNKNGYAHWLSPVLSYDYEPTITNFAKIACEWPEESGMHKQIAAWRQMWLNFSAMPETEDRAYLKMLVDDARMEKLQDELTAQKKKWLAEPVPLAAMELRELVAPFVFDGSLSRKNSGHAFDVAYWLDTPGLEVTPLTRAAFVWMCLKYPAADTVGDTEGVAFCGPDARRIDLAAIDAEAKTMGLNELGQMRAHVLGVATKALYARAEAEVKETAKKEKSLTRTAFEHPEAAFSGWDASQYQAHKAIIDLAMGAEQKVLAMQGPALDKITDLGCGTRLRAEFVAHAGSYKAKTRQDLPVKLDDYGAFLLEHLAMCDAFEGRPMDAQGWRKLHELSQRLARGPRLAVANAINDDNLDLRKTANTLPSLHSLERIKWQLDELTRRKVDGQISSVRGDDSRVDDWQAQKDIGTVSALKKNKLGVELKFKSEKHWVQEKDCKPTKKIYMVHSDGSIQYEQDCRGGKWHQESIQQDPVTVSALTASVIKPGMTLAFITAKQADTYVGFPFRFIKVAKGQQDDTITHYFLVPLGK